MARAKARGNIAKQPMDGADRRLIRTPDGKSQKSVAKDLTSGPSHDNHRGLKTRRVRAFSIAFKHHAQE
jgi:hypothetical protein